MNRHDARTAKEKAFGPAGAGDLATEGPEITEGVCPTFSVPSEFSVANCLPIASRPVSGFILRRRLDGIARSFVDYYDACRPLRGETTSCSRAPRGVASRPLSCHYRRFAARRHWAGCSGITIGRRRRAGIKRKRLETRRSPCALRAEIGTWDEPGRPKEPHCRRKSSSIVTAGLFIICHLNRSSAATSLLHRTLPDEGPLRAHLPDPLDFSRSNSRTASASSLP